MVVSRTFALTAALGLTTAGAFSPSSMASRRMATTGCSLTVEDGMDLVEASQQIYRRHVEDESDDYLDDPSFLEDQEAQRAVVEWDDEQPSLITSPRAATVAFVRRLFSQPSAAFHPHEAEGLDSYRAEEGEDVVYFPVRYHLR